MPLVPPIYQTFCHGLAAMAMVLGGIGLLPAAAQAQTAEAVAAATPAAPERGSIIISRDFGPRNALTPEIGLRHTVATAPDPADLAFATQVNAITDTQASQISGATGQIANIGANLQAPLEFLGGSEQMATQGAGSQSSGGFIGDAVGSSIAGGMSALAGALGSLPLAGQ